jgi:hypothetical protein
MGGSVTGVYVEAHRTEPAGLSFVEITDPAHLQLLDQNLFRSTLWCCGCCTALTTGVKLYVRIDTDCTAHAHVLNPEGSKV